MSDGWVAMQLSEAPRIACIRLKPSMASQPDPGWRLLQLRRVVIEVVAARALHQVAADRGHVADLSGGAEHDRLRQHRIALANQSMIRHGRVA